MTFQNQGVALFPTSSGIQDSFFLPENEEQWAKVVNWSKNLPQLVIFVHSLLGALPSIHFIQFFKCFQPIYSKLVNQIMPLTLFLALKGTKQKAKVGNWSKNFPQLVIFVEYFQPICSSEECFCR